MRASPSAPRRERLAHDAVGVGDASRRERVATAEAEHPRRAAPLAARAVSRERDRVEPVGVVGAARVLGRDRERFGLGGEHAFAHLGLRPARAQLHRVRRDAAAERRGLGARDAQRELEEPRGARIAREPRAQLRDEQRVPRRLVRRAARLERRGERAVGHAPSGPRLGRARGRRGAERHGQRNGPRDAACHRRAPLSFQTSSGGVSSVVSATITTTAE